MTNDLLALPGYKPCEYQVVLQPHEELRNKIKQVKKEFAEEFEAAAAEWGKPQITLVKFSQLQMMEERLRNRLKTVAMAMPPFMIELKDYGSYPSHTIYIIAESKVPLQMAVKHLKTAQALLKTKEKKPHFMDNFFITIARQLLPWQYEQGWLQYSHKNFTGRFVANEIILVRRLENEKSYQPVARFEFMNMPVLTKQGALF